MTESANLNLPAGWSARPACNGDADPIRALVFGALREYGLAPDPTGTDADLDDIEHHYCRNGGWFIVIEDANGELAGSIALSRHTADTAELRKMYLPRNARRRGVGKWMLERALAEARQRGYRRVLLGTASVLHEALALYRNYGFKPVAIEGLPPRCDLAMALEL